MLLTDILVIQTAMAVGILRQECRLGYSLNIQKSYSGQNTGKMQNAMTTGCQAGFLGYPDSVGLGQHLPKSPTASQRSPQVLPYTHIYRSSSYPIKVKGNFRTLLWIRAVNPSNPTYILDPSGRQVSLSGVREVFGNSEKATAERVQKLQSVSYHAYDPQGSSMGQDEQANMVSRYSVKF